MPKQLIELNSMISIPIKKNSDIEKIKRVCSHTVQILDELNQIVKPGISTLEIDEFVHERTIDLGAVPATLGYKGYPKSCCTSLNDVICHGIPASSEVLKEGDIVNIDITCKKYGFHGDSSRMWCVGSVSPEASKLCEVTRIALYEGIKAVKPGAKFGDIGASINKFIQESKCGFSIVREFTGHGIGKKFHEPPQILHIDEPGRGAEMKPGMVFTIEPMINTGDWKARISEEDGWRATTVDGGLSAQWEHTVVVTRQGVEILTLSERDQPFLSENKISL